MAHTYQELKGKTVAELREIAKGVEHEAVKGYTQLNKEHLLVALCKALSIDTHEHHVAADFNKTDVKAKINALKKTRDDALKANDRKKFRIAQQRIHALKRAIRRAEK
jgi:hypothetical protein